MGEQLLVARGGPQLVARGRCRWRDRGRQHLDPPRPRRATGSHRGRLRGVRRGGAGTPRVDEAHAAPSRRSTATASPGLCGRRTSTAWDTSTTRRTGRRSSIASPAASRTCERRIGRSSSTGTRSTSASDVELAEEMRRRPLRGGIPGRRHRQGSRLGRAAQVLAGSQAPPLPSPHGREANLTSCISRVARRSRRGRHRARGLEGDGGGRSRPRRGRIGPRLLRARARADRGSLLRRRRGRAPQRHRGPTRRPARRCASRSSTRRAASRSRARRSRSGTATRAACTPRPAAEADERFLRGIQRTDAKGVAIFSTLYPGWYQGRTVHIHTMVHIGGNVVHTGQLYFSDAVTDVVYRRSPVQPAPEPDHAQRRGQHLPQRRQALDPEVGEERDCLRRLDHDGRAAFVAVASRRVYPNWRRACFRMNL